MNAALALTSAPLWPRSRAAQNTRLGKKSGNARRTRRTSRVNSLSEFRKNTVTTTKARLAACMGEYNADGSLINEIVYLNNAPVLLIRSAGIYNIQTDQLSTPRAILNSTQTVVWTWDSDAFGATPANEDPDGNGLPLQFNLRFPGQVYDQETGLMQNWFRDYDPVTGRYIESDPIGIHGGIATYTYANSSPLGTYDRLGLAWTKDDFTDHYTNGGGADVNLGDVGLLDEFRRAMRSEIDQVYDQYRGQLLNRLQQKCKEGGCDKLGRVSVSFEARSADKTYYFTPDVLSALWVLGNGSLFNKGACSGSMNCQTGAWAGGCGLHFYVRDWFKDPGDIFNWTEGESDTYGTPYRINGDWGESRNW